MVGNGDCLNFFHVFERTLEMHDVPRQQRSYYLPSCLNSRAMKVYSRHTLEQCKVYETGVETARREFSFVFESFV